MTRHRLFSRLLLVIFGVLGALSLQACWGTQAHSEGLVDEVDKMAPVAAPAKVEPPRVTLYMTTWCPYCRKARQLLDSLDVPYELKDIEASREAAREYRAKAGGYDGIPLLDIDGRIVKGYQAELIHKLVTRPKRQE